MFIDLFVRSFVCHSVHMSSEDLFSFVFVFFSSSSPFDQYDDVGNRSLWMILFLYATDSSSKFCLCFLMYTEETGINNFTDTFLLVLEKSL